MPPPRARSTGLCTNKRYFALAKNPRLRPSKPFTADAEHAENHDDSASSALAAHDVHLRFLTVDPMWDPLRPDPRFKSVLDRYDFMRTAGLERTAPGSSR